MSEQENERHYLGEDDLVKQPSFARSNIEGYVEEEVDVFIRDTREKFMNFANDYNSLLHQSMLDRAEAEELRGRLETLTTKLENAHAGSIEDENYQELMKLKEEYNTLATESQNGLNLIAESRNLLRERDDHILDLQGQLEKANTLNAQQAESFVEPTLSDKDVANKAHALLETAAEEATLHVTRTLEKVTVIEETAHAEAAEIVEGAHKEAAEAVANRDLARANAIEIIQSMEDFYVAQLEAVRNNLGTVGYVPTVEDDGSNLNNAELQAQTESLPEGADPVEDEGDSIENFANETVTEYTEVETEAIAIQDLPGFANETAETESDEVTTEDLAAFLEEENN